MSFYAPRSSRRLRLRGKIFTAIIVSKLLKFALIGIIAFIVIFFGYFLWASRDLPTPGKLSNPELNGSTKILDKNGVVLYSLYADYNRLYVPLKDIPKVMQEATIAVEDKNFRKNPGFSVWAYFRVLKDYILYKRVTGGSTITQQLVKNVLLTSERSITRKIKELFLSIQVDRRYSKDQILELYLNNVPFGGNAVGVEAAASLYFDKHANELSLSQAAFLAGLPQAPTYYSPYSNPDKKYIDRTKHVLRRMKEDGYISKQQMDEASKEVENFTFSQRQGNLKAPHFVMYIKNLLEEMLGKEVVEKGNLTVKTTLDYEIQKKAEEILSEELDKIKDYNVGNGAVVAMDPKTGGILAMVGSKNYFDIKNDGNFNAAKAHRQPGSSLKPVMYAVALEKGYTPATLIMDVKTEFPVIDPKHPIYIPENYDGKYKGPLQMRFALGNSINVPAVKMLAKVGIKSVMQKAYEMGIENWKATPENMKDVGLSLVLGGRETTLLEEVTAYSTFANEGIKHEAFSVVEVKDGKGKIVYKHKQKGGARVLSREVSYLISNMLSDNNARQPVFGPNSWLVVPGKTVSVKTGTTDNKHDNWTVGYTPGAVLGVWVGNNDNSAMNPRIASGVTGAAPIWNRVIGFILRGKPDEQFEKPENVTSVEIDAFGGGLPVDGQPKRTEFFVKGTEPTTPSPIYKKIKMSKHDSGKLASEDEIKRGDYDTKDVIVFTEEDPVSNDGINRWQKATDEWVKQTYKDDPKYNPPTEQSTFKQDTPKPTSVTTPSPTVTSTPTPTPTLSIAPTPTP